MTALCNLGFLGSKKRFQGSMQKISLTVMNLLYFDRWLWTGPLPHTHFVAKKQKTRFKFLACCSASRSKKYPLLFIGTAASPRCFKKKSPESSCFLHRSSKEAVITSALFSDWLQMLDAHTGRTSGRHAFLLRDNCSAHDTIESQPHLQNATVSFSAEYNH